MAACVLKLKNLVQTIIQVFYFFQQTYSRSEILLLRCLFVQFCLYSAPASICMYIYPLFLKMCLGFFA